MIDELVQNLKDQVNANDFLKGGLVLGIITSVVMSLKPVPAWIYGRLIRLVRYTVVIEEIDTAYDAVQVWVNENANKKRRQVKATYKDKLEYDTYTDSFFIFFKRRFLTISGHREKVDAMSSYSKASPYFNTIQISGMFAKRTIDEFLKECVDLYEKKLSEAKSIKIFKPEPVLFEKWTNTRGVFRDLKHVYINKEQKDRLVSDFRTFTKSKDFYQKRGVSYRRGYLFYGPPGTGKSSLVSALANEFKRDLYTMNLGIYKSDSEFTDSISKVNSGSILLIEDIDSHFVGRKSKTKVGFSTFINAISGVQSKEDVVLIITTNKYESLDDALVRSGRVDIQFEIGYPCVEIINDYLSFFYSEDVKINLSRTISMADLENICMEHKFDKNKALEKLASLN